MKVSLKTVKSTERGCCSTPMVRDMKVNSKKANDMAAAYTFGPTAIAIWENIGITSATARETEVFRDGAKFEAHYKEGVRHGIGFYTFPDGTKYVGQYKSGFPHGEGVLSYPDGAKYEGHFENGKTPRQRHIVLSRRPGIQRVV
jgi:hypothetical protein